MSEQNKAGSAGILLKVLGFSIALTLVFMLVANTLPQVEGEAPVEKEVDLGALTMDSFVDLGEAIFAGKGTCTLCHNNMGRAPDILALNMVETAESRLQDQRYQGKSTDVETYLRESMIDPGVYVVKGFGKKGSNDTISPMPIANKAPIQLTDVEMDAVIAYMQAKDGNDVTVTLPTEAPAVAAEPVAVAGSLPAPAATAEEALGKYGCAACHTILGTESPVGPALTDVGNRLDINEIRQSIIDPNAIATEGFVTGIMPADFADRMMARELEMMVQFLADQKG